MLISKLASAMYLHVSHRWGCVLWMSAVSLKTKKMTCAGIWMWDPVWRIKLLRTSIKRFGFQRRLFSAMDLGCSWGEIEGATIPLCQWFIPSFPHSQSIYLLNCSFIRATKTNKAHSFPSRQRNIGKQINKNKFLLLTDQTWWYKIVFPPESNITYSWGIHKLLKNFYMFVITR